MTKPVTITVRGNDHRGGDAPTVEDLLCQIEDFVFTLREVEQAIDENNGEEIDWRVTNVTMNSPLCIEVTPTPKNEAMNIEARANKVVKSTAVGIEQLLTDGDRPVYFSDKIIQRVGNVFERVANGLAGTEIDFGEYDGAPKINATPEMARNVVKKLTKFKKSTPQPHRELGSLEGFIAKVELDGFNQPLIWLKSRIDGQLVKCVAGEGGLDRIGHYQVSEVLKGFRVRVHGLILYKDMEQINQIEVEDVHVFEDDEKLPNFEDVVAPNFTDGLEASEYLKEIHGDG